MLLFMADQTHAPPADRDWTDDVVDRIDSVVSSVRDKTAVPVIKAAQALIFGLVAGCLGAGAFVLTVIGMVRLLDDYLPYDPYARRVWTVYAAAAAIFLAAGAFAWRRRTARR